jgi:hypothetical protein
VIVGDDEELLAPRQPAEQAGEAGDVASSRAASTSSKT